MSRVWSQSVIATIVLIAVLISFLFAGCSRMENAVYGQDLMANVTPNTVKKKAVDTSFVQTVTSFSITLFQKGQFTGENSLVSPLSVYLALAMTANGAEGDTLVEFEQVLGEGLSIEEINKNVYSLMQEFITEEPPALRISNSIWFDKKNSGTVYPSFLQTNADFFGSDAYAADFSDNATVKRVNEWVATATDGKISKMLDKIDVDVAMLLINTILFDADWETQYTNISNRVFQNSTDEWVNVQMLKGMKQYIQSERATGFISNYKNGQFSFVALLPNENISLEDYITGLTAEEFSETVNLESTETCLSYLPKFAYNYKVDFAESLKQMGIASAFGTDSNFSGICEAGKNLGQIYISEVNHQTFIELDEKGTRAGAATVVQTTTRDKNGSYKYCVELNRPFLYAIIDKETKLPVFLGTVNQLTGNATEAPAEPPFEKGIQEINGTSYFIEQEHASIIKGKDGEETLFVDVYGLDSWLPIKYIQKGAYANNDTLTKIVFPFYSDYVLPNASEKIINYPENGFYIEKGAFENCSNLTAVYFSSNFDYENMTLEDDVFAGCEQVVFYLPIEGGEFYLYNYAIANGIPVEYYSELSRIGLEK